MRRIALLATLLLAGLTDSAEQPGIAASPDGTGQPPLQPADDGSAPPPVRVCMPGKAGSKSRACFERGVEGTTPSTTLSPELMECVEALPWFEATVLPGAPWLISAGWVGLSLALCTGLESALQRAAGARGAAGEVAELHGARIDGDTEELIGRSRSDSTGAEDEDG